MFVSEHQQKLNQNIMTDIYYNSTLPNYLRPSYPIDFGRPRTATMPATGLAAVLRTAGLRAAQPTFADGFVWLIKVLANHTTRRLDKHDENITPIAPEASVQRRKARLLREVSAELEAQARPASTR